MNLLSAGQYQLADASAVAKAPDQSTIIYLEGESLFFLGSELPLAMVDAWFGTAENFIDLMNKGSNAITDWSAQSSSSLSGVDFSPLDALAAQGANDVPSGGHAVLFDVLTAAWAKSPESMAIAAPVQVQATTAASAAVSAPAPTANPTLLGYELGFSTYIDGVNKEMLRDIAFDSQGNIYVTGGTEDFQGIPITPGNNYYNASGNNSSGRFVPHDVFIQKYDPSGNLLWSTRLGGKNYDRSYAIEVDDNGSVYVAGRAGEGFYTTPGALQESFGGNTTATTKTTTNNTETTA